MERVEFRPRPVQLWGWLFGAALFATVAIAETVSAELREAFALGSPAVDWVIAAVFVLTYLADQRRGVALEDDSVVVRNWLGTKRYRWDEIVDIIPPQSWLQSRIRFQFASGRTTAPAPRTGFLEPDPQFADKYRLIRTRWEQARGLPRDAQ